MSELSSNKFSSSINEHVQVILQLNSLQSEVQNAISISVEAIKHGRKIFACGNGGSASDSQHLVGELVGRFTKDRMPLPAISLNTDTSVLTCIANDFSYDDVFSRQLDALGHENDVLVIFSTSGLSKNIIKACAVAKQKKIKIIGFLGKNGGEVLRECNSKILVPHKSTARIQECHIFLVHFLCGQIEERLGLV